jgi:hypothetical protein
MKTIPTTETEIKSIIHSQKKKKKTSGYDGITSKILKVCASLISHPLTHICNHSLLTGIFPNCLNTLQTGNLNNKITLRIGVFKPTTLTCALFGKKRSMSTFGRSV